VGKGARRVEVTRGRCGEVMVGLWREQEEAMAMMRERWRSSVRYSGSLGSQRGATRSSSVGTVRADGVMKRRPSGDPCEAAEELQGEPPGATGANGVKKRTENVGKRGL
jgi:hypothetical protein